MYILSKFKYKLYIILYNLIQFYIYTVKSRYTEIRYTEFSLYRSKYLSPFFLIIKFSRYNEF